MINWPIEIPENKYKKWYEKLIEKAQQRQTIEGYKEIHHIIPNCFEKNNSKDNLVALTAREHYIAHLLLWKFSLPPKWHNKMTMALNIMVNGSGTKLQNRSYIVNSKVYEMHRREYRTYLSEYMSGDGNKFRGKTHSIESRQKIIEANLRTKEIRSAALTGEKNPMFGKTHSLEMRKKISESVKQTWTDERKTRIGNAVKEFWADPEKKAAALASRRTSPGWLSRDWSTSNKKAAETRKKNGTNIHTAETRKKLSDVRKERITSGLIVPWNKGLKGSCSGNPKKWEVTSPDGTIYIVDTGLANFCKNHPISYDSLKDVAKGKKEQIKGWKCREIKKGQ